MEVIFISRLNGKFLFISLLILFLSVSCISASDDMGLNDAQQNSLDNNAEIQTQEVDNNVINENSNSNNSQVYYVSNSSTGGDGSYDNPYNWTTAYDTAVDGDKIIFKEGLYENNFVLSSL